MFFEEAEVVMLFLGVVVLLFMVLRWSQFKQLPKSVLLLLGFSILLASWAATVLEGLFAEDSFSYQFFNYLEHCANMVSAGIIVWWIRRAFVLGRES